MNNMNTKLALIGRIKALLASRAEPEHMKLQSSAHAEIISSNGENSTGKRWDANTAGKKMSLMNHSTSMYGLGISYRSWSPKSEYRKDELHAPSNLR